MRLRTLFEALGQEVAIIFGRFNPPHKGHRAAWELASKSPVWFVGTNQSTVGPKDPLPYDVKLEAMKTIWPEVEGHIIAETSWLTMASKMYEKYPDATLLCFTDEDWVTKTIVQYNGKEGAHGFYNFKNIEQRKTPRLSSATALRDAVLNGDKDAFSKAAGVDADTDVAGKPFFDLVSEYLLPYQDLLKKIDIKKAELDKKKKSASVEKDDDKKKKQQKKGALDLGTLRAAAKTAKPVNQDMAESLNEAPIEMDPQEPMNPMIYGHDKANPAKLKYRMLRASNQMKDLAQRAESAGVEGWDMITRDFKELSMNIEQIRHALEELRALRSKGGVKSRGIEKF